MVNEQVPARRRGLLYSIVEGGWPLGLFLASGVYLLLHDHGWRMAFLFGVIPLVAVIVGRFWVKESDRFVHLQAVKQASAAGNKARVSELLKTYAVDVAEISKVTVRQLFTTPGFVRRKLALLTMVWLFYTTSWVATNVYITYWLVQYSHWTSVEASRLLLVCGGFGYLSMFSVDFLASDGDGARCSYGLDSPPVLSISSLCLRSTMPLSGVCTS